MPEAVTDTNTTQTPFPVHEPAVGLVAVLQPAEVIVPPLSHPHESEAVTVRALTGWPLLWKSLSAAV